MHQYNTPTFIRYPNLLEEFYHFVTEQRNLYWEAKSELGNIRVKLQTVKKEYEAFKMLQNCAAADLQVLNDRKANLKREIGTLNDHLGHLRNEKSELVKSNKRKRK